MKKLYFAVIVAGFLFGCSNQEQCSPQLGADGIWATNLSLVQEEHYREFVDYAHSGGTKGEPEYTQTCHRIGPNQIECALVLWCGTQKRNWNRTK